MQKGLGVNVRHSFNYCPISAGVARVTWCVKYVAAMACYS